MQAQRKLSRVFYINNYECVLNKQTKYIYTYIFKHMKCFLLSDNFNSMVESFKDGFLFYNPVI